MRPQDFARPILPGMIYESLYRFAVREVPANCGPLCLEKVLESAKRVGPQVSALTEDNVERIWEDIEYRQREAFTCTVSSCVWENSRKISSLEYFGVLTLISFYAG